jgi:hypothetical protein
MLSNGAFYTLSTGLRTTVGEVSGSRAALRASVSGGVLGDTDRRWPVEVVGVSGRVASLAMRAEGIRLEALDAPVLVVGQIQLGRRQGAFLAARGSVATSTMPPAARLMTESSWTSPWVGWLDRTGTTLGGAVGAPLFAVVGIRGEGDYDATARTLLGARGTVSYLHPCRCLAVAFSGGKRLGRAGNVPDLWLTVDLSP